MRLLDLTLPDPASNLALDEALLEEAETNEQNPTEVLRIWESPVPFVVVGRASKLKQEVNLAECQRRGIPVLRRCSGGTAVVAGPGCLMYAVILGYEPYPDLRSVERSHAYVMGRIQKALLTLNPEVEYRGTSDLTIGDQKISGNSLRCKRGHLLYHGTVLYDFPLEIISRYLGNSPPRQPDYRRNRQHESFVTNLRTNVSEPAAAIRQAIIEAWQATTPMADWPQTATQQLVDEKYSQDAWHFRH